MTRNEIEKREGPTVTINYSCFNCRYESSEKYYCQSDSGHDVYCNHPSFTERKLVGDSMWDTPDFCPFKIIP